MRGIFPGFENRTAEAPPEFPSPQPSPGGRGGLFAVSTEELQPKPEAFLDLIRRQQRGRLKIYLGFAAGVGKTFDMLQEGNRLRRQGIDVAIGFVETHGRAETAAQIGQLEQIPRRKIEYRGIALEEMDVDAVLARRPTIALVDELAHTNVPGSRNPKRYQDVEELIRAGVSVITTLNIQHLESLHDIVQRATGVRVKERVPDYVVAMADQIVNVDLSAEDLRERLQAGKIYPQERVPTAMDNFFAAEKLTQLRELAMEEIAFRLDRRRREESQRSGETASGSERVMVCLSSRSPRAAALLRKAARIADRLGAPWYAVYVQTPRESLEHIEAATQRELANNLELAPVGRHPTPVQGRRPGEHDRRVRQGVRRNAHRHRTQPAAVASPVVRAVDPRPSALHDSRRGRGRGRQQPTPGDVTGVSEPRGEWRKAHMNTVLDILMFRRERFHECLCRHSLSRGRREGRQESKVGIDMSRGLRGSVAAWLGFLWVIDPHSLGTVPLIAVGVVLMIAFLIAGNACADEAESGKKRDGSLNNPPAARRHACACVKAPPDLTSVVGWVERSEPHHEQPNRIKVGLAALDPPYTAPANLTSD